MSRLPPLNSLKAFEAAARHRNFSKAADELHVTQSAVSHQIRQLEHWFGIPLFDRQGRSTTPTPESAELASSLAEAFGHMSQACQRLSRNEGRATLTIAAIPSIAMIWLIPRLPDFLKNNPAIGIRLIHAYHHQPVDFSEVDLAITYGEWDDAPAGATHFLSGASTPVCSPHCRDLFGPLEKPEDLLSLPLLHDEDRKAWGVWFNATGVKCDVTPRGPLFEGFNLLYAALLAGQGVGLAPEALLASEFASGRLLKLFPTKVLENRAYYITEPQNPRPHRTEELATAKAWLLREAASAI